MPVINCPLTALAMRINPELKKFIKSSILKLRPEASIYLFGSRVSDELKGGDIDILVIADKELSGHEKREIKIGVIKKFGQQKMDIVSFNKNDRSSFKKLALMEAIEI